MAYAQTTPHVYVYSSVVRDPNTNKGIPGVQVQLFKYNSTTILGTSITQGDDNSPNKLDQITYNLSQTQYPVEDGRYFFHGLSAGIYTLKFYGEGLSTVAGQSAVPTSTNVTIGGDDGDFGTNNSEIMHGIYERRVELVNWCTRGVFDVFLDSLTGDVIDDSASTVDQNTEGQIGVPPTYSYGSSWIYQSKSFNFQTPAGTNGPTISGVNIATMYANYICDPGASLMIQSSFNNGVDWYTWLDTATSTNYLQTEKIAGSHFVDGIDIKVRAIITTGSTGSLAWLYDWALLTGPDLYDEEFTDHYETL